ncbi:MAG TPA: 50S ribosomal protein L24 [Patescibacteria group bacterium]|jgi:large subunit ribosomal protein L24
MKFIVGDKVLITGGKDRGKTSEVIRVLPDKNKVVIREVNMYTRHVKPYGGQAGDVKRQERPLPLAKVAIINDKGQPDRVGYRVAKDGGKQRIFKKTGAVISHKAQKAVRSTGQTAKKTIKRKTKTSQAK